MVRSWDPKLAERIAHELGDGIYYYARTAAALGYTLEEIMQMNIDKLEARREQGTTKAQAGDACVSDQDS